MEVVSEHTLVKNVPAMLQRADEAESIATTILNLTRVFDCYHRIVAYDIEANNSTSNLAITGRIENRNITTKCILPTESDGIKFN